MNSSDNAPDGPDSAPGPVQPVLGYAVHKPLPNVTAWCRLLAIVIFGYAIEQVVSFTGYLLLQLSRGTRVQTDSILEGSAVLVVWPVLGWYCWSHAPDLALKVGAGNSANDNDRAGLRDRDENLLTVALLTLGVYEFVEGIPLLVLHLAQFKGATHDLGDLPWAQMADPLVRLAIGSLLIFGNRFITRRLQSVSGIDESPTSV